MTQHTDLIDELRTCAGDPMSLDWAYIEKATITRAADALEATAKNAFEAMPHNIPQRMKDAICKETGWSGSLVSRAYIELRKAFTGEPYKANEDLDAALLEIERLRKDAERYRGFVGIMESAKGSADLIVNDHLCYYETCKPGEEVHLQWFPDTSVGSYTIKGRTIDEVVDAAIAMKAQP